MNICVVKKKPISPTETFIRAHVDRLSRVTALITGQPPQIEGKRIQIRALIAHARGALHRQYRFGAAPRASETRIYQRLLKQTRADVVLAEYGETGVAVMDACHLLGIPLVVHFHGYDASSHRVLNEFGPAYREMFDKAAGIVAVSSSMRDKLISLGAPESKVSCIPCGVDVSSFKEGSPSTAPPHFLAVGRLVDKKAPHLLILAFADVVRQRPDARLRIIGSGPLQSVCRDLITALRLNESVQMLGFQPHERVRAEMLRARGFVQHSVIALSGDSEGTPVSVMEASAAGLPVVATRHGGIPDVVLDGTTGLLVDEADVGGMAAAMTRLLDDHELTRTLGSAGRSKALEDFDLTVTTQRLQQVLESAYRGTRVG